MIEHHFQKRVRYGETDQMGYLYYGNYEIGRVEMLRAQGMTYRSLEQVHGILMPVMSMQARFVRPARYDEMLTIQTTLRQLPKQFITFHTEIFNEDGKLVNGGSVKLCFLNAKTNKTVYTPSFLMERLQPHFPESEDT